MLLSWNELVDPEDLSASLIDGSWQPLNSLTCLTYRWCYKFNLNIFYGFSGEGGRRDEGTRVSHLTLPTKYIQITLWYRVSSRGGGSDPGQASLARTPKSYRSDHTIGTTTITSCRSSIICSLRECVIRLCFLIAVGMVLPDTTHYSVKQAHARNIYVPSAMVTRVPCRCIVLLLAVGRATERNGGIGYLKSASLIVL